MKHIPRILILTAVLLLATFICPVAADENSSPSVPETAPALLSSSVSDWAGNGTVLDPYNITSAEDLKLLAERVNAGTSYSGKYFHVTQEINLNREEWTPIGIGDSRPFGGIFDGGSQNISGLVITGDISYVGLFGYVSDGVVLKNVHLEDVSISSSGKNVGGLVGEAYGSVHIENCSVTGTVSGTSRVGAIIGLMWSDSGSALNLTDCSANSTTSSSGGSVGGLVGKVDVSGFGSVNITGSSSSGDVSSPLGNQIGGLVGWIDAQDSSSVITIADCNSNGNVSTSSSGYGTVSIGGFVGWVDASSTGSVITLTNCSASGNVSYESDYLSYVGGFAGWVSTNAGSVILANCSASGTASSLGEYVGGLTGRVSSDDSGFIRIFDCDSRGEVSGNENAGGLAGSVDASAFGSVIISGCELRGNVSSSGIYSGGLAGNVAARSSGSVQISGCNADGNVLSSEGSVGGLVGSVSADVSGSTVTLTNCSAAGTVGTASSSGSCIGGLVGEVLASNSGFVCITGCDSGGTVSSSLGSQIGGLIGYVSADGSGSVSISGCDSRGEVSGDGRFVGDLIGEVSAGSSGSVSISYCNSSGAVSSSGDYVSGLAGKVSASGSGSVSISYCGSRGSVSSSSGNQIGGLAGYVSAEGSGSVVIIANSSAIGTVGNASSTGDYFGGFIGQVSADSSGSVSISYCNSSGAVSSTGSYVGDLVGWVSADGSGSVSISDCNSSGSVSSLGSGEGIGGLAGYVSVSDSGSHVTIVNSSAIGTVSSTGNYVSDLVGWVYAYDSGSARIADCNSSGIVSGGSEVGGLAGYASVRGSGSVSVSGCNSSSDVSGNGFIGGLVGWVDADNSGSMNISDCYSSGGTSGSGFGLGGLVGRIYVDDAGSHVILANCYSSGTVSSPMGSWVGGLVGYVRNSGSFNISNSVALNPDVSGLSEIGRVIGYTGGSVTFTTCHALITMNAGGATDGIDVTPADAATQTFYEDTLDWDFVNIWKMDASQSTYPILRHGETSTSDPEPTVWSGSGTESDPYLIKSAVYLALLAENVNAGESYANKYFLVTQDINLSEYASWTPIGVYNSEDDRRPFQGFFDGGNKTITGLVISGAANYAGLFGYVADGAVLRNVHLADISVSSSGDSVGGLVGKGYAYSGSVSITNCSLSGSVSSSGDYVGGLVGSVEAPVSGSVSIADCYSSCVISTSGNSVGGLVGQVRSYDSGSVSIANCYSSGAVSSPSGNNVGGLVGATGPGARITINNCVALNPSVSGFIYVGRVVGLRSSNVALTDCYALRDMNAGSASDGRDVDPRIAEMRWFYENNLGWNVDEVWKMILSQRYPIFQWQGGNEDPIPATPITVDIQTSGSALYEKQVSIPVIMRDAENLISFDMELPNDIPYVTVTFNETTGPLSGTYTFNNDPTKSTQYLSWFTDDRPVTGNNVTLCYINFSAKKSAATPVTLRINFTSAILNDKSDISGMIQVVPETLNLTLTELIKDTVEDRTWGAEVAAKRVYHVLPEAFDSLTVPKITRSGRTVALSETIMVTKYVNGVPYSVSPADISISADGKILVDDSIIRDATYIEISFFGKKLGDVTGDGMVDSGDAAFIAQYSVNMRSLNETQQFYGDVIEDGMINSGDAAFIAQYSVKLRDGTYVWG